MVVAASKVRFAMRKSSRGRNDGYVAKPYPHYKSGVFGKILGSFRLQEKDLALWQRLPVDCRSLLLQGPEKLKGLKIKLSVKIKQPWWECHTE
jgi:hypothetical protein